MKYLTTLFCSTLVTTGLRTHPVFADSHDEASQHFSTANLSVTLQNNVSHCTLSVEKNDQITQTLPLLLETPCYLVSTEKSNKPYHFSYPKENADLTLLVAGTPLNWTDDKKVYHKLSTDRVCSQYLQGIIINGNEVFAVDEKMEAPHCKGLSIDEKVFRQAADAESRYREKPSTPASIKAIVTKDFAPEKSFNKPKAEPQTHTEEDDSLFTVIQKTIKQLFSTEE